MAVFSVVTLKEVSFQGRQEQFSNAYHLTTSTGEEFDDQAAINSIVSLERAVHATAVRFVSAVSYDVSLTNNLTPRRREFLEVQGQGAPPDGTYRECAALCRVELPRGGVFNLGRRRFLSKWLHLCTSTVGGVAAGDGTRSGEALAAFDAPLLSTYWEPMVTQEHGGGLLCAPNGDLPLEGAQPFIGDYLEHRQFHR